MDFVQQRQIEHRFSYSSYWTPSAADLPEPLRTTSSESPPGVLATRKMGHSETREIRGLIEVS